MKIPLMLSQHKNNSLFDLLSQRKNQLSLDWVDAEIISHSINVSSVADPDPNPDPLVRGIDPDPTPDMDPSIIKQN